jgi:hypothetical protein
MGVDVLYQKLSSASTVGNLTTGAITPSLGVGTPLHVDDQDNWSFRFRVHRDFYP